MMARIELETVFEFLRKNGLSECELALVGDIVVQQSISNSSCGDDEVSSNDDDEFLSLASSNGFTKVSSIHDPKKTVSRSSSSSDILSQFGTARDEHEYSDLDNDDEDITDCDLTAEDKYIMSEEHNGEELPFEDNPVEFEDLSPEEVCNNNYENEPCRFHKQDYNFENPKSTIELRCDKESNRNEECVTSVTDEERSAHISDDDYETFELRVIHGKNRTGFEESKEFPDILHSTIVGRYYAMEFIGSSAFSRVVQALDLYSGIDVCLKIVKNDKDLFDRSLDEIKFLKLVNKCDPFDEHHIVRLYDYFYYREHLFIVTELLAANLYDFQKFNRDSCGETYFTSDRLRVTARQCLEALSHLHELGIVHCDLNPENIVIKDYEKCEVKIINLDSSCVLGESNLCTAYVQSRSYRAPEVILGLPYNGKMDLWSLGVVLAELCCGEVLFPDEPMAMTLARMSVLLCPIEVEMLRDGQETHKYYTDEYDLYHINEETGELEYIVVDGEEIGTLEQNLLRVCEDLMFVDFLKQLLEINPKRRLSAREALQHVWLLSSHTI